jgi:hypothetical protein
MVGVDAGGVDAGGVDAVGVDAGGVDTVVQTWAPGSGRPTLTMRLHMSV